LTHQFTSGSLDLFYYFHSTCESLVWRGGGRGAGVSGRLSAVSAQRSAISVELSAFSIQRFVFTLRTSPL